MILIDDEIFIRQKFGGVSRIFIELLKGLKAQNSLSWHFQNTYSENPYLSQIGLAKTIPWLAKQNFPLKGKLVRALAGGKSHQHTCKLLASGKVKVFHPTFYSDYFFEHLPQTCQLVFTLHDLTHEKEGHPLAAVKKKNLERANHIICVSEATYGEMVHYYPFTKSKNYSIIRLAQQLPPQSAEVPNLPKDFLLFVGERHGYKNFELLFQAFKQLKEKYANLHLVCTGNRPWNAAELSMIKQASLQNRIHLHSVSDAQLKYLYEHALCFIYPSLNEGFGIPTLEAMHCGCPVLLNDIPVFKEVAGDAAIYFGSENTIQLTAAIELVIDDKGFTQMLTAKAREREGQFTWQKHVQETLAIYQRLL